ncbi:MAG: hypothetical protein ACR2HA_09035 [Nocardioides sp.]
MTTAPRISGSGPRLGSSSGVVRPALVVTLVTGLAACVAGALVAGSAGFLGALIGTGMVAFFFASGALVLDLVAGIAPSASLLVALLTYTLQVVLVGLVFVGLQRSGALESAVDADWLGGTVIVTTSGWLLAQVRASVRTRVPLYDLPPADGSTPPRPGTTGTSTGSVSGAKEAGTR